MTTPVLTEPHHLNPEQIDFFDANGFLVLRSRVSGGMLERLREAAVGWVSDGHAADGNLSHQEDWNFADRPSGRVMFRVNYLHDKGHPAALELLGSPAMLGIAESLAGANLVPTYESMVFKNDGDGAPIVWHQDAVHPRTHRIFNIDLYLDESRAGAGALRVLPGSHQRPADICALTDAHGWEVPDSVEVEMEPGDVLVHDVMLVHGSPPTQGNALRRTIYYEFRPAEQILAEGPWDAEFIEKKMQLIPAGLAAHARQYPDAEQFSWQPSPQFVPATVEAPQLRVVHPVHSAGTYCSAGDVPIPPSTP